MWQSNLCERLVEEERNVLKIFGPFHHKPRIVHVDEPAGSKF